MIKKIIYGFIFLLILSAIAGSGYYFWQKKSANCFDGIKNKDEEDVDCGGSCISCAFKNLHSLLAKPAEVFYLGDKTMIVLFEIDNPNTRLGIDKLPYTIKLLGENNKEIATVNRSTFIYPGATKYIIESFSNINEDIKKAGLALDYANDSWKEGAEVPKVELQAVRSSKENGEFIFRGEVVNNNAFLLKDVAVYVLLNNTLGIRLAAVKSLIGEVEPFGQKQFKITIPLNDQLNQSGIGINVGVEAKR